MAIVASFAGAAGGAIAAERIVAAERRDAATLTELRTTNAAITLASAICNSALVLKQDFVRPFVGDYNAQRELYAAARATRSHSDRSTEESLEFGADFLVVRPPEFPIGTLQDLVFQRLAAPSRALYAMSPLSGSIAGLLDGAGILETLVSRAREGSVGTGAQLLAWYFGFEYEGTGRTHTEFFDTTSAIARQVDDIIFFSHVILTELEAHHEQNLLLRPRRKRSGLRVQRMSFAPAREAGLFPNSEDYREWLLAHPSADAKSEES